MVDNFELIKPLFYFNEANDMFFHLMIIRRQKDHPNMPHANRVFKHYFIRSRDELDRKKEEIIKMCDTFGARAYINVAGKDFSSLTQLLNFNIALRLYQQDYTRIDKIVGTSVGELKSRRPSWIVDIDDMSMVDAIKNALSDIEIRAEIPTKSGLHLITAPFNLEKFRQDFPKVDVHKNAPTILYIPDIP